MSIHEAAANGYCSSPEVGVGYWNVDSLLDGLTPLHYAVSNGRKHAAVYLIEEGADMHRPTIHGDTVLHLACHRRDTAQLVHYLLRKGASLTEKDRAGKTPVEIVIRDANLSLLCAMLRWLPADLSIKIPPLRRYRAVCSDLHVRTRNCCILCYESFSPRSVLIVLSCRHGFHQMCLAVHLERRSGCPCCGGPVCARE